MELKSKESEIQNIIKQEARIDMKKSGLSSKKTRLRIS